ncbi:MAG: hypothetical protein LBH97_01765 [Treponema sp.]|jgi:hypothetical protein|nr:hypothetical protein [Treponema sp.]
MKIKLLFIACLLCCSVIITLEAQTPAPVIPNPSTPTLPNPQTIIQGATEEPPPETINPYVLIDTYEPPPEGVKSMLIHIMPITGVGIIDNDYVTSLIEGEIATYRHTKHDNPETAEYIIIGTTGPYIPNEDADLYEGEDILYLQLFDNRTGYVVNEQNRLYVSQEELMGQFEELMRNIFMAIPPEIPEPLIVYIYAEDERWRMKILYVDGRIVWAPRYYQRLFVEGESVHAASFGAGVAVEWQFLNFMAVELAVDISPDRIQASYLFDEHPFWTLGIPLSVKYVWKPKSISSYMFLFGLGAQLNLPLIEEIKDKIDPSYLSLIGNVQMATRAGQGAFFVDLRLSWDINPSRVESQWRGNMYFNRWILFFSVGYKHGFFPRPQTKLVPYVREIVVEDSDEERIIRTYGAEGSIRYTN